MIEYYTTQDLIEELMKRKTFVGVLIFSLDENVGNKIHDSFGLKTTMDKIQTVEILKHSLGKLEE